MRIRKKTNIYKLDNNQIQLLVNYLADHCEKIMGINKRKRTELKFRLINTPNQFYGYYDSLANEMFLNLRYANNIKEFIKTFLHEYTHYMQPIRTKYHKLFEEWGYKNHPFEIEARKNEIIYFDKTFKIIKKTFDSIK